MTTTLGRGARHAVEPAPNGAPGRPIDAQWVRTPLALLASCLGITPLAEIFTDLGWLGLAWLSMLLMMLPALIIRLHSPPRAWHDVVGIVLVVPWLIAKFLPQHALFGFLPTTRTWRDVDRLMDQLHATSQNDVAPLHSTPALQLMLCVLLALLAAAIDLLAVVAARGVLAGVPLLVIYTISGAIPQQPVSWWLFALAAIGFLILMGLDADGQLRGWGRLIPRASGSRPVRTVGVSGQRIAVIAIAVAVVLPLLLPAQPRNLLSRALHNGSSGHGVNGFGGSGTSLNPYVALRGDLTRSKPVNLATVSLDRQPTGGAYYLRANVLSRYNGSGWTTSASSAASTALGAGYYGSLPATGPGPRTTEFTATIKIDKLTDNPPVFDHPAAVSGLSDRARWDPQKATIEGEQTHHNESYTEVVAQPNPSQDQLANAPSGYDADLLPYLQLPNDVPAMVRTLVRQITAGQSSQPYAQARALNNYFTDPANGFSYALQTQPGDSPSDLVNFLNNKMGFCQQFAGALGVMLRIAGIPARVVLGYTHPAPNASGSFTVTTNNAHAWVEAYFNGIGWIPFDPTPLASGTPGGATAQLPWAPHASTPTGASGPTRTTSKPAPRISPGKPAQPTSTAVATPVRPGPAVWPWITAVAIILALAALASAPAATRLRRRRRRLAGDGGADAVWAELRDTSTDLGYAWSPARTPRQVADWLGEEGVRDPALRTLAAAVERSRYAPRDVADRAGGADGGGRADRGGGGDAVVGAPLRDELRRVESELRLRRSRGQRLRARLIPSSLRRRHR